MTGRGDYIQPSRLAINLRNTLPALRSNGLFGGVLSSTNDFDDPHWKTGQSPGYIHVLQQPANHRSVIARDIPFKPRVLFIVTCLRLKSLVIAFRKNDQFVILIPGFHKVLL